MTTPNLGLPELAASQAQKHVTHNEALAVLDAVVQLSAISRTLTAPPASPADGDRYLVPAAATGAWAGLTDQIASFRDGAWQFMAPKTGWTCYVAGEGLMAYSGTGWAAVASGASGFPTSAHGASITLNILEQEVTLAGASVDTTIAIPDRAIVLAVSVRTTTAITGATSYNVGVAGETSKFGGSLGISVGSTNIGIIGPTGYYAATPIRISANGANFTGGKVRVAIQYFGFTAPAS